MLRRSALPVIAGLAVIMMLTSPVSAAEKNSSRVTIQRDGYTVIYDSLTKAEMKAEIDAARQRLADAKTKLEHRSPKEDGISPMSTTESNNTDYMWPYNQSPSMCASKTGAYNFSSDVTIRNLDEVPDTTGYVFIPQSTTATYSVSGTTKTLSLVGTAWTNWYVDNPAYPDRMSNTPSQTVTGAYMVPQFTAPPSVGISFSGTTRYYNWPSDGPNNVTGHTTLDYAQYNWSTITAKVTGVTDLITGFETGNYGLAAYGAQTFGAYTRSTGTFKCM